MALKGLDIFKLSPKKNCKECGSPTCMAFSMKVAQGAVQIDACPYFSEEAKAALIMKWHSVERLFCSVMRRHL